MPKVPKLTDILSTKTLEKILDNFSEATNLACVIRDIKGTPITKMSSPSRLWLEVHKHPAIEKAQKEKLVNAMSKVLKTGQTQIFSRYIDTHAFLVPIYLEGQIVAFFVGGLSRFGNPDMNLCTEESKKLRIDLDTYLEMYLELPLVTEKRLLACASLLRIIATTISTIAKQGTQAIQKANEMKEMNDILEEEITKNTQKLEHKEFLYRNLFNSINDGVYVTDQNGIIKEINKAGASLLGYKVDELIGTNMKDLYVNPADREEFLSVIYNKGQVEHLHPHVRLKNGKTKYFDTDATVIRDSGGKIVGVQGIFRNLDHRIHSPSRLENDAPKTARKNIPNNQSAPQKT